jgi:hypothetical protein
VKKPLPFCSSKVFLGLILLFLSFFSKGQEIFQGHYLSTGMGFNTQLFRDAFYANFRYSTYSAIAQLGYYDQNKNWQNTFYTTSGFGLGKKDYQEVDNYTLENIPTTLHYSLRYRVANWSCETHSLWAGVLNQNSFNYRVNSNLGNSSETFAGFFSYGLSAAYQFNTQSNNIFNKAKPKIPWGLQFNANLPIGSYVLRPGYATQIINGELGFSRHLFWRDFFHLNLRSDFILGLQNGNQLRISYRWDYSEVSVLNQYHQGQHQILLTTYFRF